MNILIISLSDSCNHVKIRNHCVDLLLPCECPCNPQKTALEEISFTAATDRRTRRECDPEIRRSFVRSTGGANEHVGISRFWQLGEGVKRRTALIVNSLIFRQIDATRRDVV